MGACLGFCTFAVTTLSELGVVLHDIVGSPTSPGAVSLVTAKQLADCPNAADRVRRLLKVFPIDDPIHDDMSSGSPVVSDDKKKKYEALWPHSYVGVKKETNKR